MTENIRAKILAEALREIDRHGSAFHMDDLARKLRISKRTLYEYFFVETGNRRTSYHFIFLIRCTPIIKSFLRTTPSLVKKN